MQPASDSARYHVPALERGLRLLQLFNRQQVTLGAPDIARALQLSRSTVFRLLQTLEALGFVESHNGQWRLGAAVLRLGFEYAASLEITELARPLIDRLRDDTGCAAQLAIRDGSEVVFVLRASDPSAFSSNVQVGTRMPAHATVLGRMFLIDLSEAELRALYPQSRLPAYSEHTPRSVAELSRQLQQDRLRGHAVSESFFERGISAIAAPVRDGSARVVASLSITVSQPRIEPASRREQLVQQVMQAADTLSHRLNYRPAAQPKTHHHADKESA